MKEDLILDPQGNLLVKVAHFHDREPTVNPVAFDDYLVWLSKFNPEKEGFKTVVHDSTTFTAMAALNAQQYKWNRAAKEPRQWYGAVTSSLSNIFLSQYPSWDTNVVLLAHIHKPDEKMDLNGMKVIAPGMPGQLKNKVGGGYSEFYRAYIDPKGGFVLQTRPNALYPASTQIDCPNPCAQTYSSMWGNRPKEVTQCLVYGDPGSGKSHFAATWPTPMCVILFDPKPKASAYYRLGIQAPHALSLKEH